MLEHHCPADGHHHVRHATAQPAEAGAHQRPGFAGVYGHAERRPTEEHDAEGAGERSDHDAVDVDEGDGQSVRVCLLPERSAAI